MMNIPKTIKSNKQGSEVLNPSPPPVQFDDIDIPDRHYHHDNIESIDAVTGIYELDDEELSGRTGVDDEDQDTHFDNNSDRERKTQDDDDD